MLKWKWYYKNGTSYETFTVIYNEDNYVVVMNDDTGKYSFGLKRDFGTLYGFPVNQACLTLPEIKRQLQAFVRIDTKYLDSLGEYAKKNIDRWNAMLHSINQHLTAAVK